MVEDGVHPGDIMRAWSVTFYPHLYHNAYDFNTMHQHIGFLSNYNRWANGYKVGESPEPRVTHLFVKNGTVLFSLAQLLPSFPKLTHVAWDFEERAGKEASSLLAGGWYDEIRSEGSDSGGYDCY